LHGVWSLKYETYPTEIASGMATDRQTRQTMLVYFTWLTKGPWGHQVSWPWVIRYAYSAVIAAIHKAQKQL